MKRVVTASLLILALGISTRAAAGARPRPRKGKPTFRIPKHWKKCKTCKMPRPPRMPCPNCPPEGFVKCGKCGAFHAKSRKCAACAEKKIPRREARCPVCKKSFMGPVSFNHNDKGGTDMDFCRHSLGKRVVEALVWTCPRCGHTHWSPEIREGKEVAGNFNEKVDRKYARGVEARVKPLVRKMLLDQLGRMSAKLEGMLSEMDQLDVPDWIKYEAGLKCAEIRGESSAMLAKMALEGSYACRRELVRAVEFPALSKVIPALEGAITRRGGVDDKPRTVIKVVVDMLRASELIEMKKRKGRGLKASEKYYFYLKIAACWDRLGNAVMADRALNEAAKALRAIGAKPRVLAPLAGLVLHRKFLLKKESAFRARAAEEMRKALTEDNAYPGGTLTPTIYLLGELYRREGDFSRARPWLVLGSKMAAAEKKDHPLTKLVGETMRLPSMRSAEVNEKEETAVLTLVARLTGRKPEELIASLPKNGGGEGPVVGGKPKNCTECLKNLYRAFTAYVAKKKKAPPELEALVKDGFITEEAAAGFKCPECGKPLFYRPARDPKAPDQLLIWHGKSDKCRRLLLYTGGKIVRR